MGMNIIIRKAKLIRFVLKINLNEIAANLLVPATA